MSKSEGFRQSLMPFRWYIAPRADGKSVILWWEKRRIPYNILLLLFGIFAIAFVSLIAALLSRNFPLFSSLAYVLGIVYVFVQVAANIWYTGGWVVELVVVAFTRGTYQQFGSRALLLGTLFSFVFTILILSYFAFQLYPEFSQMHH